MAGRRAGRAHALLAGAAATLALAGCGAGDSDPGPGGVTVGEKRALDQAAEMLEDPRLSDAATATPTSSSAPRAIAPEPPQ